MSLRVVRPDRLRRLLARIGAALTAAHSARVPF